MRIQEAIDTYGKYPYMTTMQALITAQVHVDNTKKLLRKSQEDYKGWWLVPAGILDDIEEALNEL